MLTQVSCPDVQLENEIEPENGIKCYKFPRMAPAGFRLGEGGGHFKGVGLVGGPGAEPADARELSKILENYYFIIFSKFFKWSEIFEKL